jgi:hypothetical protein
MLSRVALLGLLAALNLAASARASDVQRGDRVMTLRDAIGCYDRQTFEKVMAPENRDMRAFKVRFPPGCLKVNAPFLAVVESIDAASLAVCIRGGEWMPACVWFPIDDVRVGLAADQRRT